MARDALDEALRSSEIGLWEALANTIVGCLLGGVGLGLCLAAAFHATPGLSSLVGIGIGAVGPYAVKPIIGAVARFVSQAKATGAGE